MYLRKMKSLSCFFFFLIVPMQFIWAQNKLDFRLVETQGFNKSWVSDIAQDQYGFIWLGTQDGLYRYDGYDMLSFRSHPYEATSLPGNWVRNLDIDASGEVWIATYGGGLSKFNKSSLVFQNFNKENPSYGTFLRWVKTTENGNVFLVSDLGVYSYTASENKFLKLPFGSISSLIAITDDNVVVTSKDTIHILSLNNKEEKRVSVSSKISAISAIGQGKLLFGSKEGVGMATISGEVKTIIDTLSVQVISNAVNKKVFLASENRLYEYNIENDSLGLVDSTSFIEAPIQTLFIDKDQTLWVGTQKGLYKGRSRPAVFFDPEVPFHIRRITTIDTVLCMVGNDGLILKTGNTVTNLFEDTEITAILSKDQYLWMGTKDGDLIQASLLGEVLQRIHLSSDIVDDKYICDVVEDKKGRIWAGSLEGIYFLNMEGILQKKIHLPLPKHVKNQKIIRLLVDSKDRLWFTTAAHGLFMLEDASLYSKDRPPIFNHFSHNPNTKKGITSNIVFSIDEATNGAIWLGTDCGVAFFNESIQDFQHLEINNQFFDKKVMAVRADLNNNLWISTIFDGVFFYDKGNNTFVNFTMGDGLISNAFLYSSGYLDKEKNILYFGTDEGLQQINLEYAKPFEVARPSWISSLIIYRNNISEFIPVTNPAPTQSYNLTYNNRDVTVNFSTIDYNHTEKTKYAYSFDGEHWTELPKRTAHFTNLSIGTNAIYHKTYFLGQNTSQNGTVHKLMFLVAPPWYRTNLAYFIYFSLFLAIIIYIYNLLLNNRLAKQKMESALLLDEAKSTMYANISHEFKTPLTLINGLANRLLKKTSIPEEEKQSLHSINENGEQLLHLVNQMLELVSIDTNQLSKNYKNGDVVLFVKKCVSLFYPFADLKEIKLRFHSSIEKLLVDVDDEKLQKVINNLLSNAIKFTPKGGTITVRLQQINEKTLKIEVEDSGKGIKAEDLPHIFDRYYKTFDLENNIGSGIGMELTKGLVSFMEGTITVKSTIGKGTLFTILLPIKKTAKATSVFRYEKPFVESNEKNSISLHSPPNEGKDTILIVEDHVDIRNYFKDIFANQYRVLEAPHGKKALEIAENKKVDFIISDVMMPVMDGFEFCERLKNNAKTSHLPFVMVTAKTDVDSRLKGYKLGVDAYINKPFQEEELLQIIKNLLAKRAAQISFYQQILELKQHTDESKINVLDIQFIKKIQELTLSKKRDLSMEALARELLMSRSQLHRKIKQLTAMSITQYINHIKLEKAKQLLLHSSLSVSEIAYEVDFEDPKYFSRVFKKAEGKTPSDFRENLK